MKKRLFSFIICTVLSLTLLSGGAWAEVLIAGTDVTGGEYWKNNADNTGVESADAGTANAYYQDGTLYLNNLNVTSSAVPDDPSKSYAYAIYTSGDLTLNLQGSNAVSSADSGKDFNYAIYVGNALTVTGDGSLTATGGDAGNMSYGVYTNSIAVSNSAKVAAIGGDAYTSSVGLSAREGIEASDSAKISGDGGDAATQSSGIITAGAIKASDSAEISGVGGSATNGSSYGIKTQSESIEASDSASISGVGGKAAALSSGITTSDKIKASDNSSISGAGGECGEESTGISSGTAIEVSDTATVSGVGGSSTKKSTGIDCQSGNASYAGGTLIAKSDAASKVSTALSTRSITLTESYYWRTSETGNYKHAPENKFSLSRSETYLELRTQLPSVNAPYYNYTVETTDKGFLIDADLDKFLSLRLDGVVLDEEDYTLTMADGKLLITLDRDFLKALPKGEHTLFIYLTDGFAEVKFTVE